VTNYAASDIENTSVTVNGGLLDDGELPTTVYLFWGTSNKGTNSFTWPNTNALGQCVTGPLSTSLTNLLQNKKYYCTFYATNACGYDWTKVANFTTKGQPSIQNDPATGLGPSNAVLNGTVNSTGGVPTQVYVVWDVADRGSNFVGWAHTNAFGVQKQVSLATNVTGLSPAAAYYYRFYATNQYGGTWATPAATFTTLLSPNYFWWEAESGVVGVPMTIAADSNTSGGAFVYVYEPPGTNYGSKAGVAVSFTTTDTTNYALWTRVWFPNGGGNSFMANIDGGTNVTLSDGVYSNWHWLKVPYIYLVGGGSHWLTVSNREDDSRLDCLLLISDTNFVPTNAVSAVPADSDGDGIPDLWMQQCFRQAMGLGSNKTDAAGDWDGDGLCNWGEYVGGSNPTNWADRAGVSLVWSNGQAQLRYTARQASGFGYAGLSRYFTLGEAEDLLSGIWDPVPGGTNILGAGQTVIYPLPAPAPAEFYRLTIELR
jgi:hypothetical protein